MSVPNMTGSLFDLPVGVTDKMYAKVDPIEITDLTSGVVDGAGAFDKLMASLKAHLRVEFEKGRITGAEYTKAYIELTQAALQTALQFVLGKEQAFWAAQTGQIQAITARVGLENAKFEYENTLPLKKAGLEKQNLVLEGQAEVQHAQISNTLLDGVTPISGVLGAQKNLYVQQVTSYQRDAEVKAAKLFSDAWITQKTIDDGLVPPTGFTNASVDAVLTHIKTNNGLT